VVEIADKAIKQLRPPAPSGLGGPSDSSFGLAAPANASAQNVQGGLQSSKPPGLIMPIPNNPYSGQYYTYSNGRLPDYLSININAGSLIGLTPVSVTLDRYGNLYFGGGGNVGKSISGVSYSITAGWMNLFDSRYGKPTEDELKNLLSDHGFSVGAGLWLGSGVQWSTGNGYAVNFGIVSPQFGGSYTYSRIKHFNIGW